MASPRHDTMAVRVDKQGRLVLPQHLREGLVRTPGEVLLRRTPDGILIESTPESSSVTTANDGLPVLMVDRVVSNGEVLKGIDAERAGR